MASIFISYRRADGLLARPLYKELEERFDVFFDTESIEYGDRFPREIEEELGSCRVFFAVIGPNWIKKKNIRRLHDEKDWVKREIETALQRKNVRIVPILLGIDKLPPADDLPEALRPLSVCNSCKLSHEKWNSDSQELLGKLDNWLSGHANQGSSREPRPLVLPYLCNRNEQEDGLIDLIEGAGEADKHFIVILHGHKWEEHVRFIDRLRHQGKLEKIFKSEDVGVDVKILELNREKIKAGECEEALIRSIKRSVIENPFATNEELQNYFKSLGKSMLFVMQTTWSDQQYCGTSLFSNVIRAWKDLFISGETNGSAKAIRPSHPVILWINVSYDDERQELAEDILAGPALPRLRPLSQGPIMDWMEMREVKPHINVAELKAQILAMIDDPNLCCGEGRIHMLKFAEEVEKILNR